MANKSKFWQEYGKRMPKYLDIVSLLLIILVLVSLLSTFLEYLEHPNWIRGIIIIITIITICRVCWWVKELVRRNDERKATLWNALGAVKAVKTRINLLIELQEKSQPNAEDIKAMETLHSLLEPHEALNILTEIETSIEKAMHHEA